MWGNSGEKPSAAFLAAQRDDALKVSRLREEIEGLNAVDPVSFFEEVLKVAHLRGGIAGDVDDPAWSKGEELVEEILAAALSRGVDED